MILEKISGNIFFVNCEEDLRNCDCSEKNPFLHGRSAIQDVQHLLALSCARSSQAAGMDGQCVPELKFLT
jgi:hypothetical protein